jgi:hypothetical protein
MEVNSGYYIQLIDRTEQRMLFSASTGNFDKEDFAKLWDLVGKRVYDKLQNSKNDQGHRINFEIEASKL